MSAAESVVVVGASLGGLRVAEALRRSGHTGVLTIVGEETHLPYNRPPLSKEFLASGMAPDALRFPLRPEIEDVSWIRGTRIAQANLQEHTLTAADGRRFGYDILVAATGLRPRHLESTRVLMSGEYVLRTVDDALALRSATNNRRRVVVIGGGFIGCEVAATLCSRGCQVTVIARDALPLLRPLGRELAAELMNRNESHGVRFVTNTGVIQVLGQGEVSGVLLDNGTVIDCDIVIEAIGSAANTEWLEGNDINTEEGILTDSGMRALRKNGHAWDSVYAVGDVARFPNGLYGDAALTVEHWNIPIETAKRAAQVITASTEGTEALEACLELGFAPVPSFWSDQFDVHLLAYGVLGYAERVQLMHGDVSGDCVFGYFQGDDLVGVCGIGSRSTLMKYRRELSMRALVRDADGNPIGGPIRRPQGSRLLLDR